MMITNCAKMRSFNCFTLIIATVRPRAPSKRLRSPPNNPFLRGAQRAVNHAPRLPPPGARWLRVGGTRDQSAPIQTSVAGGVYPQARYRRRESCVTACAASVDHLRYRPRSVSCQMSLPVAIINGRSASMPALPTARSSCASSASLSCVSASSGSSSSPVSRSSSMMLGAPTIGPGTCGVRMTSIDLPDPDDGSAPRSAALPCRGAFGFDRRAEPSSGSGRSMDVIRTPQVPGPIVGAPSIILLLRETGLEELPLDAETRDRLAELAQLERAVGKAGMLALRPLMMATGKDIWQLTLLGR